jgi:hypothetical protein
MGHAPTIDIMGQVIDPLKASPDRIAGRTLNEFKVDVVD